MVGKILSAIKCAEFDYSLYASPDDDNRNMLDEFNESYRHLYAICKTLAPLTILELGVSHGYSAISLLKATPSASYVGIYNGSENAVSCDKAISWAKKITMGYNVTFINDDTQQMASFPGDMYDLILIDNWQSGDGIYHDLELAFAKGKWVLVNNYFWHQEKMLSITYFTKKYSIFIDTALLIPGFGGQFLIKVKDEAAQYFGRGKAAYKNLDDTYDSEYYLTDCGGYDSFRKYNGRVIEDPRLLTVIDIVQPQSGLKVLDLGCGRGELAFTIAKRGATVTGVDYSRDAIAIAEKTFADENVDVKFLHGDLFEIEFKEQFDCITASDVVEHVEQPMLDRMIAKASKLLHKKGLFIIHTAPNRLELEYSNKQRRQVAQQIGCYLPKSPRTYYADLQHLNEQTPAKLNRAVKKHFKHVVTWCTTLPDPVGSLIKPLSKTTLREGTSLFAVASHAPIDVATILKRIRPDSSEYSSAREKDLNVMLDQAFTVRNWIQLAEGSADAGAEVTPMARFFGIKRTLALFAGKVVVYLASFITDKQRAYNHAVVSALKALADRADLASSQEREQVRRAMHKIADLRLTVADHEKKIEALYKKLL